MRIIVLYFTRIFSTAMAKAKAEASPVLTPPIHFFPELPSETADLLFGSSYGGGMSWPDKADGGASMSLEVHREFCLGQKKAERFLAGMPNTAPLIVLL